MKCVLEHAPCSSTHFIHNTGSFHMNPMFKTERGSLLRWSLATFMAVSSASAQAQFSGVPSLPTAPPLPTAELLYSRNFASMVGLIKMNGSFYDARVTAQFVRPDGGVGNYVTYSKRLDIASFNNGSTGPLSTGDMPNSLTFTVEPNGFTPTGGSFTLSQLRWDLNIDGTANVWANFSGTGVEAGDMLAWTSSSVTRQDGSLVIADLKGTDPLFFSMADALGISATSLAYPSLQLATSKMGTLTISAVPEAATWAQLGLGLVGLGVVMRRRAKPCGDPACSQA
jgi:hypothetical protein